MRPEKITLLSDKALTIQWDDGHEGLYFAEHLRRNCPCATCDKERELERGKGPLKIIAIRLENIKLNSWQILGRYALSFMFSDHHNTGIYRFEFLRSLCQCDQCTNNMITVTSKS